MANFVTVSKGLLRDFQIEAKGPAREVYNTIKKRRPRVGVVGGECGLVLEPFGNFLQ